MRLWRWWPWVARLLGCWVTGCSAKQRDHGSQRSTQQPSNPATQQPSNQATQQPSNPATQQPRSTRPMRHALNVHLLEIKYEFLKAWRMPQYSLPTLLFPIFFYSFFGVAFGKGAVGTVKMAEYLIATYGTFGVIGAALFGFGVSVAVERGQGWLEAKRTTPMPISAYFISKMALAAIFSTIIVLLLFVMGRVLGGVQMPVATMLLMLGVLVAGSVTFCALGL